MDDPNKDLIKLLLAVYMGRIKEFTKKSQFAEITDCNTLMS